MENNTILRDENGQPMTAPTGLYSSLNAGYETVPGLTLKVKGSKFFRDLNQVTPYHADYELIERKGDYVFAMVNDSWFTFKVESRDGNEFCETSRRFIPGINDSKTAAYQMFLETVAAAEQELLVAKKKADSIKTLNEKNRLKTERIAEVQQLKAKTLSELKTLVKGQDISTALKDKKVASLVSDFNTLETLLKSL
jgi:hypothetical protein